MSNPRKLPAFMINVNSIPRPGSVQAIARITREDMNTINKAAHAMRMKQSEWLRTCLIRTSERALYETYGPSMEPST